jgi:hypothetical protein
VIKHLGSCRWAFFPGNGMIPWRLGPLPHIALGFTGPPETGYCLFLKIFTSHRWKQARSCAFILPMSLSLGSLLFGTPCFRLCLSDICWHFLYLLMLGSRHLVPEEMNAYFTWNKSKHIESCDGKSKSPPLNFDPWLHSLEVTIVNSFLYSFQKVLTTIKVHTLDIH